MLNILITLILVNMASQCESSQVPMIITKEAHGQEFIFSVSDEYFVSLKGNPTTGYTWSVSQLDSTMLRQIGEAEFRPESKKMGAPGQQIFRFLCLYEGQTELHFIYHRPWEKDTAPIDSFYVTVVIDK